jgi:lysophospholipase L1-like esterase
MKLNKLLRQGILLLAICCIAATGDKVRNLLIIGDSISIGYTPFVEKALAPGIIVSHNPGNGGSTIRGVDSTEVWLNHREWDMIVFNFGLHDLVYKDEQKKYDVVNGKISVSLDDYRKNLETIVARLKETTAKLLFVTTTVVPENSAGRKVEDPAKYNEVAISVMKKNGIPVVDLYTASLTIHPENSKPGNVHYTDKGYELLADELVKSIKSILK